MVNNLTKLPDRWFVKRNKYNAAVLNKWNNDTYSNGNEGAWNSTNAIMFSDKNYQVIDKTTYGYTEITFEQFEMWILNKNKIIELW